MIFEKGYFQNSKISNYQDYTSKKFEALADDLARELNLGREEKVLDFGCATGGLVAALRLKGFNGVMGTDISYWAISHGRTEFGLSKDVLHHYNRQLLEGDFSIVLMLDVFEHVHTEELDNLLGCLAASRIAVRIPVSALEGDHYVLEVSRADKTHIQVHTKDWWSSLMRKHGFVMDKLFSSERTIHDSEGVLARIFRRV